MKLLASFLEQVIKEVVHTGKIIAFKSCSELSINSGFELKVSRSKKIIVEP